MSTVQLGARLRERRLGDRALAYERSDPGIERFELRARRRRFGHRLRPRLLELGTRLRQCRSGRFERVRPYLQFATRLVELRLRRRSDDLRGRAHGFELGHPRMQRIELGASLLQLDARLCQRVLRALELIGLPDGRRHRLVEPQVEHRLGLRRAPGRLPGLRPGGRALDRLADLVGRGGTGVQAQRAHHGEAGILRGIACRRAEHQIVGRRGRLFGRLRRRPRWRADHQVIARVGGALRIGAVHLAKFRRRLAQGLDQRGIVLRARAGRDLVHRLLGRHARAAILRRGCALERIDDRHHASGPRDLVALQAPRVAAAIPVFVVRERERARELEQRILVLADDLGADRRVPLELLALRPGQRALVAQQLGGHGQLADVVHRRRLCQELGGHLARARRQRERPRILRKTLRAVAAKRALVPVHRAHQPGDALLGALQARRALARELLEMRADALQEHRRGERLHQEVERAERKPLHQPLRVAALGEKDHRHVGEARHRSQRLAQLVAAHARRLGIEQDELRRRGELRPGERGVRVGCGLHHLRFSERRLEEAPYALGGVDREDGRAR